MRCWRIRAAWRTSPPRARAAGASAAEIQEVVEVAYLFSGTPALVTAMNASARSAPASQRVGVATKIRCEARSSS